ncbi:unnamed protein product [Linum trigynum]|uniref:Uncharacterized protein n=1 Tax=Linum trigynum TaxID=586398 RepID=A0AAV2GQT0_9ROSI
MISLQVRACSSSFQGEEILLLYSKNALKSPSLSLGFVPWVFGIQNPALLFFGSEFGLKPGNPDSHGQGARPCISPFWPCNSKRSVSFSRTSALSHGQGARPCELQGLPVRVLGIRRTAILLTCTAVQPPWSARAACSASV